MSENYYDEERRLNEVRARNIQRDNQIYGDLWNYQQGINLSDVTTMTYDRSQDNKIVSSENERVYNSTYDIQDEARAILLTIAKTDDVDIILDYLTDDELEYFILNSKRLLKEIKSNKHKLTPSKFANYIKNDKKEHESKLTPAIAAAPPVLPAPVRPAPVIPPAVRPAPVEPPIITPAPIIPPPKVPKPVRPPLFSPPFYYYDIDPDLYDDTEPPELIENFMEPKEEGAKSLKRPPLPRDDEFDLKPIYNVEDSYYDILYDEGYSEAAIENFKTSIEYDIPLTKEQENMLNIVQQYQEFLSDQYEPHPIDNELEGISRPMMQPAVQLDIDPEKFRFLEGSDGNFDDITKILIPKAPGTPGIGGDYNYVKGIANLKFPELKYIVQKFKDSGQLPQSFSVYKHEGDRGQKQPSKIRQELKKYAKELLQLNKGGEGKEKKKESQQPQKKLTKDESDRRIVTAYELMELNPIDTIKTAKDIKVVVDLLETSNVISENDKRDILNSGSVLNQKYQLGLLYADVGRQYSTIMKFSKLKGKGYKVITHFKKPKIYGRGMSVETQTDSKTSRYRKDRKYYDKIYIDLGKLKKNILFCKYIINNSNIPKLKTQHIDNDCKDVILDIISDKYSERMYNRLDDKNKRIVRNFIRAFKFDLNVNDSEDEEFNKQYQILLGSYYSGNDSPEITKQLKKYVRQAIAENIISQREGLNLLFELG